MVLGITDPHLQGASAGPEHASLASGAAAGQAEREVLSWRAGMGCHPQAHDCSLWPRGLRAAARQKVPEAGAASLLPLWKGRLGRAARKQSKGREESLPTQRTLGQYHFQRSALERPHVRMT